MTTNTANVSSLIAKPYTNPQHAEEALALEAKEQEIANADAKANGETPTEQPVSHNWEKRYKDLQSYHSKQMHDNKIKIQDLQVQGVPKLSLPKTPEEIAIFKEANPDTYAMIETMAANIAKSHMEQYDTKLANVTGDLMDTKIERAALALKAAHPDYETIVADDAFHTWAETQGQELQSWIYDNPDKPELAIRAISLYKYSKGDSQQTNTQQSTSDLDASIGVNVRQSTNPEEVGREHPAYIWKESEFKNMRPEEFAKWEEIITLASREGRLLIGQ